MSDPVHDVFTVATELGDFTDALTMPLAEYEALSPEQIAAIKLARAEAWVTLVKAASVAVEE